MNEAEQVLEFWFGTLSPDGFATPETEKRWFTKDPAFDAELDQRFGAVLRRLATGEDTSWRATSRGALAYVIVLDQFSRNVFRGTPGMFAADVLALDAAKAALDAGHDRALGPQERTFLYMPFMHSEALEDQDRCVALFRSLAEHVTGERKKVIENNVVYAIKHRDIVARFGRFPHRNATLGRPTTTEEAAFLLEPGSSF